ncbi:hypothetical protein [Saccharothrix deserti]|uniref:hypothetical protein n=1 Tax=Saccharothrix deserti TaxID=2593674 RepID=UPI00131B72A9|nr:hypothetical protein [Saccharothrix deserti]
MPDVQQHRQRQYAIHTVALGDGAVPGAASLFDTALTNGLLAIVASDWPGEELWTNQQTKPASKLIQLVKSKIDSDQWLIAVLEPLPFPPDEPAIRVEVDLTALCRAVDDTQPIRHGRDGGTEALLEEAVKALRGLDMHPALGVLSDAHASESEIAAATAAAAEYDRVATYIELVGEDEIAKRAARSEDALPSDPKERYDSLGLGWCDMCGHNSLVISQVLRYGSEIGTCFACSYVVTEEMVDDSEFYAMLRSHDHE